MRRMFLVLGVVLAACGGDNSVTDPAKVTFAGTYTMQTIDGQRLPYVAVQQGTTSLVINSDRLTMVADGSWSETLSVTSTQSNATTTQTLQTSGTWVRSGNSLEFVRGSDNGTAYTGTFSQNRLDLTASGLKFVFTK